MDYNTKVTLSHTYIEFNGNAKDVFKIGDILNISREFTTESSMTQIVTVTSIEESIDTIPLKKVNFSPELKGDIPSDNTLIRCYILARRSISKATYSNLNKNIYVYSFSLNPEEHQPSGTCNFSRLNDCKLVFSSITSVDKIFATNYNILRISNGLTSLRFTN